MRCIRFSGLGTKFRLDNKLIDGPKVNLFLGIRFDRSFEIRPVINIDMLNYLISTLKTLQTSDMHYWEFGTCTLVSFPTLMTLMNSDVGKGRGSSPDLGRSGRWRPDGGQKKKKKMAKLGRHEVIVYSTAITTGDR